MNKPLLLAFFLPIVLFVLMLLYAFLFAGLTPSMYFQLVKEAMFEYVLIDMKPS